MAEYINRSDVISKIAEQQDEATSGVEDVTYYRAISIIRKEPAADVQPVRHAKCERDNEGYERCSACNEHETNLRYFNFCPHCGAKLDVIYQDGKFRAIKVV